MDKLLSVTEEMGNVIAKMSRGDVTRDEDDDDDDVVTRDSDDKRTTQLRSKVELVDEEDRGEEGRQTHVVTQNICKSFFGLF